VVVRKIASATIHSTAVTVMCQMMARVRPSRKWSAPSSRVSLHESRIRSPVGVDAECHPCRKMSAGQRATATALVLHADGRRHSDGRILNYKAPEELDGDCDNTSATPGCLLRVFYGELQSEPPPVSGIGRC
jgi:hypothetical protein